MNTSIKAVFGHNSVKTRRFSSLSSPIDAPQSWLSIDMNMSGILAQTVKQDGRNWGMQEESYRIRKPGLAYIIRRSGSGVKMEEIECEYGGTV